MFLYVFYESFENYSNGMPLMNDNRRVKLTKKQWDILKPTNEERIVKCNIEAPEKEKDYKEERLSLHGQCCTFCTNQRTKFLVCTTERSRFRCDNCSNIFEIENKYLSPRKQKAVKTILW